MSVPIALHFVLLLLMKLIYTCSTGRRLEARSGLRALDALPFPLEYRHATVHVPIVDEGNEHPVHMVDAYSNLIVEINSLERHFTSADLMQVKSAGVDGACSVRFGARLVGATQILQTTLQLALTHSTEIRKSGFVGDPMDHYDDPDMGIGFDNQ